MSEICFVLKDVVEDFKSMEEGADYYGDNEEHLNILWNLSFYKTYDDSYEFGLFSVYEKSEWWSADTEYEFRLIGKEVLTWKGIHYHHGNDDMCCRLLTVKDTEIDKYLIDGKLTIECHVKILKTEGIEENEWTFDTESFKKSYDVVLVVDGEKFYVSKTFLGFRSTGFDWLLMRDSKLSYRSEVVLEGIKAKDLQNFLELLYAETEISDQNVEGILRVADKYKTNRVIEHAEEFLLELSNKSKKEKFALAVKYKLKDLKDSILSQPLCAEEIRSLVPDDLNQFDNETMAELFKRYLSATTAPSSKRLKRQ